MAAYISGAREVERISLEYPESVEENQQCTQVLIQCCIQDHWLKPITALNWEANSETTSTHLNALTVRQSTFNCVITVFMSNDIR